MFPFSDNIPRVRPPIVTYLLIVVNVWMFMIGLKLPDRSRQELSFQHGFVPARLVQLVDPKPLLVEYKQHVVMRRTREVRLIEQEVLLPGSRKAALLTLFSYMFMHGGWLHLGGNMMMLWIFGDNVEDRLGATRYLVFYLIGGIIAALGHWAYDPRSTIPVIGASGAIAAVMGAYLVAWPWARVRTLVFVVIFITIVELPAVIVLGIWFLTQVLHAREAMLVNEAPGVAWWTHIAGFLYGALMMPLMSPDPDESAAEVVEPEVVEPDVEPPVERW